MTDEMKFELRQIEMREKSRYTGLARRLRTSIGLELDGIDDILAYMPDDPATFSIRERVSRMRVILDES